ncbi:MAG: DNA internalization-related competence protein ComEC/Rec2 [Acetatifactor muris]|nr:DNA internalization-related competence protein ComEC/Rec2 [Acetatifactor muris]
MTKQNSIFAGMRRPLFFCAVCLVILLAAVYHALPDPGGGSAGDIWAGKSPPDGTTVTLTGQVIQKDGTAFVIQIRGDIPEISVLSDDAATPRQDDLIHNSLLQQLYTKLYEHMKSPDGILCEYDAAQEPDIGSAVTVRGEFYAFSRATNPGEFDYARYYRTMGCAGRLRNVRILEESERGPGIREALYRLRCYWKERLYRIFPEKEASVMTAVLLGDKEELDEDVKALYQRNGIIHILSISGLHITLIGMGFYRLLRRLGAPVWFAAVSGGLFVLLYGIMTGLGVSACRAMGMYLLRMLAQLWGRTYDMLTALGVMAAVMLCVRPLEHMGFCLSFGSILGVGALLPALTAESEKPVELPRYVEGKRRRRFMELGKRFRTGLWQSFAAGLSITLTTLPVQLWFTYEIPVYSVLLNMLILPFMGVLVAAGLAAMLIPGMGIAGTADVVILAGYEKICELFERLPHTMWNPGRPESWQILLYYLLWAAAVGIGAVVRRYRKREQLMIRTTKHPALWRIGQFALLAMAVLCIGMRGYRGDRVTFPDVGQGDCVCVQLASGEVYLFDCGSSSRSRIGERVLIPFLKYNGIHKIDAIFLSHGDADHVNGILELLAMEDRSVEIGQIVLPGIERDLWQEEFGEIWAAAEGLAKDSIPVTVIRSGMAWSSGEDDFLCLHPASDGRGKGGNEGSECFYIELREGDQTLSLLLTGDVEGAGESSLLSELTERGIRDVTVFKVPHHGSKNSTSERLLGQVRPVLSVISCGRNNRYGHPHAELLERLENSETMILDTPGNGAVTVELREDRGVRVRAFGAGE